MNFSVEKLAEILFEVCSDRSLTSTQASNKFLDKVGFIGSTPTIEKYIGDYKNSGSGLENTAKELHKLLYGNAPVFEPPLLSFKNTDGIHPIYSKTYERFVTQEWSEIPLWKWKWYGTE